MVNGASAGAVGPTATNAVDPITIATSAWASRNLRGTTAVLSPSACHGRTGGRRGISNKKGGQIAAGRVAVRKWDWAGRYWMPSRNPGPTWMFTLAAPIDLSRRFR